MGSNEMKLVNRRINIGVRTYRSKLIFVSYQDIGLAIDLFDNLTGKVTIYTDASCAADKIAYDAKTGAVLEGIKEFPVSEAAMPLSDLVSSIV